MDKLDLQGLTVGKPRRTQKTIDNNKTTEKYVNRAALIVKNTIVFGETVNHEKIEAVGKHKKTIGQL